MSIMDKIKRRDDTIARLKNEVRRLENFRRLADRQKATIGKLTRQLSAEKRMNNALSKLLFAPKQPKAVVAELKRANTFRRKAA